MLSIILLHYKSNPPALSDLYHRAVGKWIIASSRLAIEFHASLFDEPSSLVV